MSSSAGSVTNAGPAWAVSQKSSYIRVTFSLVRSPTDYSGFTHRLRSPGGRRRPTDERSSSRPSSELLMSRTRSKHYASYTLHRELLSSPSSATRTAPCTLRPRVIPPFFSLPSPAADRAEIFGRKLRKPWELRHPQRGARCFGTLDEDSGSAGSRGDILGKKECLWYFKQESETTDLPD